MKLMQLIKEQELMDADDFDNQSADGRYERQKAVSLLILRTFRKCGFSLVEGNNKYNGPRETHDYYGFDIIYDDYDHEASVLIDDVELHQLVMLNNSGLIDGKCVVTPTQDGVIRLTFKVHSAIAKGNAKLD
jgi:hypothetical protein